MMTTRGMTCAEAEARLAAQMPVEEKAKRSHYVIHNDGTADELRAEAQKLVAWLSSTKPLDHLTT
jgi:dephospho-CoA kinase